MQSLMLQVGGLWAGFRIWRFSTACFHRKRPTGSQLAVAMQPFGRRCGRDAPPLDRCCCMSVRTCVRALQRNAALRP